MHQFHDLVFFRVELSIVLPRQRNRDSADLNAHGDDILGSALVVRMHYTVCFVDVKRVI